MNLMFEECFQQHRQTTGGVRFRRRFWRLWRRSNPRPLVEESYVFTTRPSRFPSATGRSPLGFRHSIAVWALGRMHILPDSEFECTWSGVDTTLLAAPKFKGDKVTSGRERMELEGGRGTYVKHASNLHQTKSQRMSPVPNTHGYHG